MGQLVISYIIPLLAPVLLVFRHLFSGPLATWGDAPFFYAEGLKNLVSEPLAWIQRGLAFGGVNNLIWISPLMLLYGLIGNNDLAVRLIFYLPSIVLAGIGMVLLAKYLTLSKVGRFLATLIFLLNTYYILLIDGGQVGVALAYGIFPLALLYLKKFFDKPSTKSFFSSLAFSFILSVADPRVNLVCVISVALWAAFEGKFKKLLLFIPLGAALAGLSMYWLYPLIKDGISSVPSLTSAVGPKWYHSLTLFAPNWPNNLFGKIAPFNLAFIGLPLLIIAGAFLRGSKDSVIYFLLFLTFSLFATGIIPLGFIFRDTTKFFIPVVLFAAILIGRSVEVIKHSLFKFLVYGYLLFLVYPALAGRLNFVLSGRQEKGDSQKIYRNLKSEDSSFRAAWFPERHPLAYETAEKLVVDARDLIHYWPFANMNAGEDPFNFLNNSAFVDWFRILGIKYLILSGNPREIVKDESQAKNWQVISNLVASNKDLEKVNWGTNFPIYQVDNVYPRFFAVKKLYAVVGTLPSDSYPFPNTVFFEDGKLDPTLLEGRSADAAEIIFNKKDKADLAMSFLQKYFVAPKEALKSEWATYSSDEYLKYKYELLIRGVKFDDFDYGQGLAFSTVKGEKVEYRFEVPGTGEYVLAERKMVPAKGQDDMTWETKYLSLKKGQYVHVVQNDNELSVLNAAALIPKKDYDAAVAKADVFTKHFKVVDISKLNTKVEYQPVALTKRGTLNYDFKTPEGYRWVILTENYHPLWQLRKGIKKEASVPAFSMANAFYVDDQWKDYGIFFGGQTNVRWGIYWSVASLLVLSIIYLKFSAKNNV